MTQNSQHIGFRGTPELLERIDRVAKAMQQDSFGASVSRSAIIKALCEMGLPEMEQRYFGGKRARRAKK